MKVKLGLFQLKSFWQGVRDWEIWRPIGGVILTLVGVVIILDGLYVLFLTLGQNLTYIKEVAVYFSCGMVILFGALAVLIGVMAIKEETQRLRHQRNR